MKTKQMNHMFKIKTQIFQETLDSKRANYSWLKYCFCFKDTKKEECNCGHFSQTSKETAVRLCSGMTPIGHSNINDQHHSHIQQWVQLYFSVDPKMNEIQHNILGYLT